MVAGHYKDEYIAKVSVDFEDVKFVISGVKVGGVFEVYDGKLQRRNYGE